MKNVSEYKNLGCVVGESVTVMMNVQMFVCLCVRVFVCFLSFYKREKMVVLR